jgi:Xaa-Pro aminopeptidase
MTTEQAIRPSIAAERYRDRLQRAGAAAVAGKFDALLLGVGPDLAFLTGYKAHETERLTMLVVIPGKPPVLVVPRLEQPAAKAGLGTNIEVTAWAETQDPFEPVVARLRQLDDGERLRLGVSDRLWTSLFLRLERAVSNAGLVDGVEYEPASVVLRELRMSKDADEVELLRLAARAADRVVDQIAAGRLVGRTEADVAREVRDRLIAEGHDTADFAIVASGPNAASPHHEASDRVIQAGEPIVLDIGGILGGYCSDTTRTLWVTGGDPAKGPDEEFRRIFGLVREAQAEASSAVRPGMPCGRLDEIARRIIEAGGYGPQFLHRLGHGIGREVHEEPYLVAGNEDPLRAGIAFSVEPGIYLEGRYGVRIEDIVVCGPDGPIVLNESSRELRIIDG